MPRSVALTAAVALVAAGGVSVWWLASPRDGTHAAASVPVDTTAVVRTTLTTTTQLSGTLGYSGSDALTPQLQGTITALPTPGAVLRRGASVYEVDGASVYLFYGARPAWRPFEIGMTPGADVLELEQNLDALGYGAGLAIDDTFTWATADAVQEWQVDTGQPVTGRVDLGRVAFAPTALRVSADSVPLGAPAQPGQPVLTATSPTPVVTVPVPTTETYLVHRGNRVTVTMPSGATATGHVADVSPVAAATDSSGSSSSSSQGNGPQLATVPALIALDQPTAAAGLDQAPVTVSVVDQQVSGVLAVPITSLVALAGGGYAVWVDAAGRRNLIAVTPGLFANTLVQVTAPLLRVGERVEVPVQ
jgi:hypothetical protein